MNECKKYQLLIESYIEGELGGTDKKQLKKHTQDCPTCRKEYAEAKTLALVLDESFQPAESGQQAAASVMASVSGLPLQDKSRHPFTSWKIAAGFIVIAGLFLSYQVGRTSMQWTGTDLTQTHYRITELNGDVLVKHSNSEIWKPLQPDSVIYVGDALLSTPDAHVKVAVEKQSFIELKENSMLVLDITPDKTDLHLIRGTLDADLASPHGPFFVTTPHGRAEALGTEFTVKVD